MKRSLGLGIAVGLLAASCGGSGGGAGNMTSAPVPAEPAAITSANAPVIAAATMNAVLDTDGLGAYAGAAPAGGVTASSAPLLAALAGVETAGLNYLEQSVASSAGTSAAQVAMETITCAVTGQVTITVTLNNDTTLSKGDTILADYVNCDDGDGVVVDGVFSMSVADLVGDFASGMLLLSMDIELSGFTVRDGDTVASADGIVSIDVDTRTLAVTTIEISTLSLTLTHGDSTHTLTDYTATQVIDQSATSYTLEVSGSLTSSAFEGQVDFESTVTLQTVEGQFAFAGEIVISGAENASIHLVVVDGTFVSLEIDVDGDSVIDETIETTWQELLQAA